jgi:hypothetical protein
MDISSYFTQDTLMIVATLWVLGMIIKDGTNLKNKKIPMILVLLGILFAFGLVYAGELAKTLMVGVLAAGSAVFTHGAIKDKVNMTKSEVLPRISGGIRSEELADK